MNSYALNTSLGERIVFVQFKLKYTHIVIYFIPMNAHNGLIRKKAERRKERERVSKNSVVHNKQGKEIAMQTK